MAETIRDSRGWGWADMFYDLKTQGEIEGLFINPLSIKPGTCSGTYKEVNFVLTWKKDNYFLLSMEEDDKNLKELVQGFSKVIEYYPFCKYKDETIFTYEWDKIDPSGRFKELESNPKLRQLEKIIVE